MIKNLVNSKFGRASAMAMMLSLPFCASADDGKCSPLLSENGYTLDAPATAQAHSRQNIGEVAIAALPGDDVGNTPAILARAFKKKQIDASCFINDEELNSGGTVFSFFVAGLPITYDGKTEFGIDYLMKNKDVMRVAAAQAVSAKVILASNTEFDSNSTLLTAARD